MAKSASIRGVDDFLGSEEGDGQLEDWPTADEVVDEGGTACFLITANL